ncbi:hypothetical protein [Pontibacter sp. SGAir0037]|uniref:hypothetical protein n=1 Tax=Pontibacter sp. SGAir0037 TaxID=2571030 RepID=UPI0010CD08CE|nr:hypothetical protein [Pontibacter sp. SGAir0037]QCR23107.1 hypothetical protein C1N53_12615 [Pontibacter sp. SGAir0037]
MAHRGEIVEAVVRSSGISLSKLHKKLNISRGTLYNKFDDANLEYEFILEVGRIIHHDFTEEFPNMFNPAGDDKQDSNQISANDVSEASNNYYRPHTLKECERALLNLQSKYISLLETHQALLTSVKSN